MNTGLLRRDLDQIGALEEQLASMRAGYHDSPDLFEIYSQGVQYQLDTLRTRLREHVSLESADADLWIRLKGSAIGAGSGSLEVVTAFLERFRVAAKHAVSVLEGVPYAGGRFAGAVESATNFQLVATAPGSFQIGLASALPTVRGDILTDELFGAEVMRDTVAESHRQQAVGLEGLKVVLETMGAADNADVLGSLRNRLGDHGLLRVLFHARALFPRGIDSVEFHGRAMAEPKAFTSTVRERLRELGEQLVAAERYIAGVGVVQMMDLARNTLRLDYARVADLPAMTSVSGEYEDALKEIVASAGGRPVFFSGSLRFDAKGQPQRVAIDYLEPFETEESEEQVAPAIL